MEKKKVIKKKIDESTLRNIIYKKVLEELNLKEYRGVFDTDTSDGDRYYTRPNGRTNYRSYPDDSKMGKRALGNSNNMLTGKMYKTYGPGSLSHGKGHLCYELIKLMEEKFQLDSDLNPNGKIEWTEKEIEAIKNVEKSLFELAKLSKKEGNKKRGYDRPEELNEAFGHTTEEEKLEAMRQWKEENLADDLDWEICDRIDYYDTCLAGTVTSDEGWEFTAYGNGDEHGDFISFDDNEPEVEFKMPDGREGYFNPNDSKVTMSESNLRNYIYEKVKRHLNEEIDFGGVRQWAAEHGYSKADIYGNGGQEEAGEPLLYDFPKEIEDRLSNEYHKTILQQGEQPRSFTPEEERIDKLFDKLYAIGEKYDQQCSWVKNDAFSDFVGSIPSSLSIPGNEAYDNTQEVYSDVVRFFKEISPIIAEIIQDDASRIQDILVKSFKRELAM